MISTVCWSWRGAGGQSRAHSTLPHAAVQTSRIGRSRRLQTQEGSASRGQETGSCKRTRVVKAAESGPEEQRRPRLNRVPNPGASVCPGDSLSDHGSAAVSGYERWRARLSAPLLGSAKVGVPVPHSCASGSWCGSQLQEPAESRMRASP